MGSGKNKKFFSDPIFSCLLLELYSVGGNKQNRPQQNRDI